MPKAGRPEKKIAATGPDAAYAQYLRAVRRASGLTFTQMSEKVKYGASTLSKVSNGQQLSAWHLVQAYIRACDGDIDQAKTFYEDAKNGRIHPGILAATVNPSVNPPIKTTVHIGEVESIRSPLPAPKTTSHPARALRRALHLTRPRPENPSSRATPTTARTTTRSLVVTSSADDHRAHIYHGTGSIRLGTVIVGEDARILPDPDNARTMADLAASLDQLRRCARLTWRELADRSRDTTRSGGSTNGLAISTLHETITKRQAPSLDLTRRVVELCDLGDDVDLWIDAWQRIAHQHNLARAVQAAAVTNANNREFMASLALADQRGP